MFFSRKQRTKRKKTICFLCALVFQFYKEEVISPSDMNFLLNDQITDMILNSFHLFSLSHLFFDHFQGKEAKMAFLQKAIDVVALVSGEPLTAKPARIVAGHEPEKTNELLQAIGKCCLNKVSRTERLHRKTKEKTFFKFLFAVNSVTSETQLL